MTDYIFSSWTLTPGAGGKFQDDFYDNFGGGGGGVMVDGAGPQANEFQGQGYGGGGDGGGLHGLQGVILLEVVSGK